MSPKVCRYINGFFTSNFFKLDCHYTLIDDVIQSCSFIDLDNGEVVDVRILGFTPFEILNSSDFVIYFDDKYIAKNK